MRDGVAPGERALLFDDNRSATVKVVEASAGADPDGDGECCHGCRDEMRTLWIGLFWSSIQNEFETQFFAKLGLPAVMFSKSDHSIGFGMLVRTVSFGRWELSTLSRLHWLW